MLNQEIKPRGRPRKTLQEVTGPETLSPGATMTDLPIEHISPAKIDPLPGGCLKIAQDLASHYGAEIVGVEDGAATFRKGSVLVSVTTREGLEVARQNLMNWFS